MLYLPKYSIPMIRNPTKFDTMSMDALIDVMLPYWTGKDSDKDFIDLSKNPDLFKQIMNQMETEGIFSHPTKNERNELVRKPTPYAMEITREGGWLKHLEKIKQSKDRIETMEKSIVNVNYLQWAIGIITVLIVSGNFYVDYKAMRMTEQANQDTLRQSRQLELMKEHNKIQKSKIELMKQYLNADSIRNNVTGKDILKK